MAESSCLLRELGVHMWLPIFLARSNNFPVEQQLLLGRELGSVGSTGAAALQRKRGWSVCRVKAALSGTFFKWWFSKRGTNKVKKPPHSLPALLQRPFLGRAGPRPHLQQKNWLGPGTFDCASVVDPLQCSWEPPA